MTRIPSNGRIAPSLCVVAASMPRFAPRLNWRFEAQMYDEKFMRRAIELSAQSVDQPGTRPYGAVVVKDGKIVGEGLNHSPGTFDPTSHGEVEAIRDACRN